MKVPITVLIPVGPAPHHTAHLPECLASVRAQMHAPDEILVIDNGTGLREPLPELGADVTLWRAPWALGLATGFNAGIGLARNRLVFCLGSDDLLDPRCLLYCWQAWQLYQEPLGWYFVGVRDSTGYEQNTACLAAMVTKDLWQASGGFALCSDCGKSCEAEFISRMILAGGRLGATYRVSDEVLYFWRKRLPEPA